MNKRYFTHGDGVWYLTTWKSKCSFDMIFESEGCQGVAEHMGHHWCFRADGSYSWYRNEMDPVSIAEAGRNIACGWTPPDHEHYVSPVSKVADNHIHFHDTQEVTDQDVLDHLNSGGGFEDASVDSPFDFDDADDFTADELESIKHRLEDLKGEDN